MTRLSPEQREAHYLTSAKAWVASVQNLHQAKDAARQTLQENPGTVIQVSADTTLVDAHRQFSRGDNRQLLPVGHMPFSLPVTLFVAPIAMALDVAELKEHVMVRRGDATNPLNFPTLVKARLITEPGAGALVPTQWGAPFWPDGESD